MKPILFNTPMTQAIVSNRKSATRRIVKPQPNDTFDRHWEAYAAEDGEIMVFKAPYEAGDILYVRETWRPISAWSGSYTGCEIEYKAGGDNLVIAGKILAVPERVTPWRPSIHMPKDAARIFLRVTNVQVERLQEMTVNDLISEGIASPADIPYGASERFDEFKSLWNSTIKPTDLNLYSWDANPWVWVIEFERCEKSEESTRRETN